MLFGILSGLLCGALWGLTFVAPRAVDPFGPFDFTVVRYGFFGVLAVVTMLAVPRYLPTGLSRRRMIMGFLLGAIGYNGYFLMIAYAVKYAGAAIPPLIVGTLPVVLAIIGNFRERTVAWRRLVLPLGLIAAGVVVVNLGVALMPEGAAPENVPLGTLCAVCALALWVWYGVVNGEILKEPSPPTSMQWTGLQGIGSLVGSLALIPMTSLFLPNFEAGAIPADRWANFLAWGLLMGFAASWLATILWIQASRLLPVALTAQLIVSETVFGLFFGFLWEQRFPTMAESVGITLQIAGVIAAIFVFTSLGRVPAGVKAPT